MAIESRSANIIFWIFAMVLFLLGISSWFSPAMQLVLPILMFGAGTILLAELGIKRFTNLSDLDEFNIGNWIVFFVALFIMAYGIMLLFPWPFAIPSVILDVAGVALVISGIAVAVEILN